MEKTNSIAQESCGYSGIGKAARRRMIKRWKEVGTDLSLKQWARLQHPVGDAAFAWISSKQRSS